MDRDYAKEIDELRNDIQEIKQLLTKDRPTNPIDTDVEEEGSIRHLPAHMVGRIEPEELAATMRKLTDYANAKGLLGAVAYTGVFSSSDNQRNWFRNEIGVDSLFALVENGMAAKVLQCVGSNDRMSLLLRLMKKPMSVSELLSTYGYTSTGQIYHLLKPLLAADIVKEDKSVYEVRPYRVHGIIMLLTGIADLLDDEYTAGEWHISEE